MTTKYVTVTGAGAKNGTDAANAWDWATMLTSAAAGDDILIQEGTYSLSSSSTFSNSGTSTSPIRLRGAKADWTPLTPTRTNAGPLSTANMPVIAFDGASLNQKTWSIIECLKITGNVNNSLISQGVSSVMRGCVVETSSTGSSARCISLSTGGGAIDCDFAKTGASGTSAVVSLGGANGRLIDCRILGGATTAYGVQVTAVGTISGCLIVAKNHGIYVSTDSNQATLLNNTVAITGGTGDAVYFAASSTVLQVASGNLLTDSTAYGINGNDAATAVVSHRNRIDRSTSGAYNGATDWLASTKFGDDVTSVTQANEYEDAAGGDFRLKSTSPAIGKGPWGLADIGALQTTGGGSTPAAAVPFSIGGRFGRRA